MFKTTLDKEISHLELDIIKRKRKSIALQITDTAGLRVLAPKYISNKQIINYVNSKKVWILEKTNHIKITVSKLTERQYVNGEKFSFAGKDYYLNIHTGRKEPKILLNSLIIYLPKKYLASIDHVKTKLVLFYKKYGLKYLKSAVEQYKDSVGDSPTKLNIKQYKSTWGNCSSTKEITINWKLFIAPKYVIDYVIIHEMCHLIHFNHSRQFWNLVLSIDNDYKESQQWLHNNRYLCDI